ncbi:hypothetical protein GCK72_012608 [Caenorhabditis remanei]|uniref:Neurotransmitter-gated ion-channel ligand-binding domain-containing protein n=1 Tax=Caenorhabditis remanei TaxID=31234 RepID=A0A6A5GNK8_CAERE|nr:hypothetical protein GCK72_012608 [Caenorhabditis remanei]KAF1756155.1 hypothetical protein GCK72_012608 [Caenorhabditis remanei]
MDVSTGLQLLNLISLNINLTPSAAEYEKRFEADDQIRRDIFRKYDGSMPFRKDSPLQILPVLTIDHIRSLDQNKGTMTVAMSFLFTWMDDRLAWNSSNYSGVQTITGHKFDFYLHDLWLPTLHLADMPGSAKQQDLFKNHDVDIVIHKSGTVRASIKALITTPCYFGFGDYPNDYQNCTFTLMSPYFADAFQFSDWGGFAYSKYLLEDRISDVQDFMLINVDSHRYFMYLGMDVVENIGTLPPGYCRGFYRYVLTLKRMNKLVFSQLTAPMIVIIVLMTIAGFLPNRYGLPVLLATLGIELMFTISMTDVLPDNFNGMPNIGILAILLVIETMVLTAWKVFSIYTRNNRRLRVVKEEDQIYQIVIWTDRVLMVALIVEGMINIHIAKAN